MLTENDGILGVDDGILGGRQHLWRIRRPAVLSKLRSSAQGCSTS